MNQSTIAFSHSIDLVQTKQKKNQHMQITISTIVQEEKIQKTFYGEIAISEADLWWNGVSKTLMATMGSLSEQKVEITIESRSGGVRKEAALKCRFWDTVAVLDIIQGEPHLQRIMRTLEQGGSLDLSNERLY